MWGSSVNVRYDMKTYYIVILRWLLRSRRLHHSTAVIRRVRMVRWSGRNEGATYCLSRAMSPKLGQ